VLVLLCLISATVLQSLVATGDWWQDHWCCVICPHAGCHSSITAASQQGHTTVTAAPQPCMLLWASLRAPLPTWCVVRCCAGRPRARDPSRTSFSRRCCSGLAVLLLGSW
jgi:hypothetical protein